MAKRAAVLMKLRDGVTRGEVRELEALLRRIGDPTWLKYASHYGPEKAGKDKPIVQSYDDQYGDPCFYIP